VAKLQVEEIKVMGSELGVPGLGIMGRREEWHKQDMIWQE